MHRAQMNNDMANEETPQFQMILEQNEASSKQDQRKDNDERKIDGLTREQRRIKNSQQASNQILKDQIHFPRKKQKMIPRVIEKLAHKKPMQAISEIYNQRFYPTPFSNLSIDFSALHPYRFSYSAYNLDPNSSINNQMPQNSYGIIEYNHQKSKMPVFNHIKTYSQCYPITQLRFSPNNLPLNSNSDILITSNEILYLYSVTPEGEILTIGSLSGTNSSMNDYQCPIVSFDWQTNIIVGIDLEGSLKVWDVNQLKLIENIDNCMEESYSVSYHPQGKMILVSGDQGTLKVFNPQSMKRPISFYQTPSKLPIFKIEWNRKGRTNEFAVLQSFQNTINILDIRFPNKPCYFIKNNLGQASCIKWSPHEENRLMTGYKNGVIYIRDLSDQTAEKNHHVLQPKQIIDAEWSRIDKDILGVCFDKSISILHRMTL